MHLFELADLPWVAQGASVPAWALGCFRRRSISFFSGAEDTSTEVVWMQSRGLTADFRRVPGGPEVSSAAALGACSLPELLQLCEVEGGLSPTHWDGHLMHWSNWVSFQTHAKWPEPGRLTRVGNCLIELAPSGAYVEDWRYEPCGGGPLIGLSLLDEVDADAQTLRHRGGGLIVCGRHAAFVRGRPAELASGQRVQDLVRGHQGDARSLGQVFAFDAAYGTTGSGRDDFTVTLSTLPWRMGKPVVELEGFSFDESTGLVLQRAEVEGQRVLRRFSIDTLEHELRADAATEVSPDTRAWFESCVAPNVFVAS